MTTIMSWNVAGIRAVLRKNALDFSLNNNELDVICFQETKAEQVQVKNIDKFINEFPYQIWNHSKKRKGYSGTSIWSKTPFINTFQTPEFDNEGRICAVEFDKYILLTVYTPNSKADLSRLDERVNDWDVKFCSYCDYLKSIKPLIICGDLNVCHKDIDIYEPEKHRSNVYAGFTNEERTSFSRIIEQGYFDAFREFHNEGNNFTWWSYYKDCRTRNIGWRLDYFLVDNLLKQYCTNSIINKEIYGSDHCPISCNFNFN